VCAATYARRRVGLAEVDRFTTESGSVLLKPCVHSRACVGRGGSGSGQRRGGRETTPTVAGQAKRGTFVRFASDDRPTERGWGGLRSYHRVRHRARGCGRRSGRPLAPAPSARPSGPAGNRGALVSEANGRRVQS
jgi:hypothetical protein